jgi:hypothetical protein
MFTAQPGQNLASRTRLPTRGMETASTQTARVDWKSLIYEMAD